MKRKIYRIIYQNFIVFDKMHSPHLSVGGIQTYIYNLAKLIKKLGGDVVVYQYYEENFKTVLDSIDVIGIKRTAKNSFLSNKVIEQSNADDIIIFADERYIVKTNRKCIAIQHGVYWDKPHHQDYSSFVNSLYIFLNAVRAYKRIHELQKVDSIVAVDHNFVNWYRTQLAYPMTNIHVIPNFSKTCEYTQRHNKVVNIIFARRFFPHRGTRIFATAIEKILKKYKNVNVFIAGNGPDEEYLKNKFKDSEKVRFGTFEANKSLEIHKNYDIAVVPTLGSEGTSLSLLEAMSASCAVIATNVGGITNIVLDGYNGIMINPDETSLYNAMERLITDEALRTELSKKAYETVNQSFSHEIWEEKWTKVLEEIVNE